MNVRNEERAKVEKEQKKDCNSKRQRKKLLRYSSKVIQLTCSVLLILTCCSRGIRRQRQRVRKSWTNYSSGWRSGWMAIHHLRTRDGRMKRSRGLLLFMQQTLISVTRNMGVRWRRRRENWRQQRITLIGRREKSCERNRMRWMRKKQSHHYKRNYKWK